jgi:DNA-binding HxlR family transcriptional regulator
MSVRPYGQFCGFARAAEIIGERWAFLILRDLLVGPKRFTDLHRGLVGIPTNVLTARLKELEQAGVVQRRVLPRPEGSVVYELTQHGMELEDVVIQLGRWGSKLLGEPRRGETLTVDALIMAMRSTFRREAALGVYAAFELHVGEIVIHARVDDGTLEVAEGALTNADLIIETGTALKALMAGEISSAEAIDNGSVLLTGDPELLSRFVKIFHIGSMPAA